jgi:hypothetical protein
MSAIDTPQVETLLLSPNKAAALAGISATRLREAIRLGKLKAVMVTRGEIETSNRSMSAFPPKRTFLSTISMSAMCQEQTFFAPWRGQGPSFSERCGYPEVISGTVVARQIFDKLLTLLASITRDAEPVDSTVEHHANRTTCY